MCAKCAIPCSWRDNDQSFGRAQRAEASPRQISRYDFPEERAVPSMGRGRSRPRADSPHRSIRARVRPRLTARWSGRSRTSQRADVVAEAFRQPPRRAPGCKRRAPARDGSRASTKSPAKYADQTQAFGERRRLRQIAPRFCFAQEGRRPAPAPTAIRPGRYARSHWP